MTRPSLTPTDAEIAANPRAQERAPAGRRAHRRLTATGRRHGRNGKEDASVSKRHQSSRRTFIRTTPARAARAGFDGATSRSRRTSSFDEPGRPRRPRPVRVHGPARAAAPLRDRRLAGGHLRGRPPPVAALPRPRRRRRASRRRSPRRRIRGAVRAAPTLEPPAVLLGGIVVAFALAFFSLAQSVRVSATGYDINRLLDRARLAAPAQAGAAVGPQPARPRARRSASRRSTPASASSPTRSSSAAR